jgi:PPP family 3-phenylpropionic acid transporter
VSRATPIAVYYFAFLAALGIFWPFLGLHLASLGLGSGEITLIYGLIPLMSLIAPPLVGLVADLFAARVWLLRGLTALTALAFAAFLHAGASRPALYAATLAFALCRAPLGSMADASAVEHVRRHGGTYGRLRLWGSIGFLVAVVAGGFLVDHLGIAAVLPATMVTLVVAAVAAWAMPAPPPHPEPLALPATLGLLGSPTMWLFLGAVALAQVGGAAYDACYSLHLGRLGYGGRFTGVAWAVGVLAEILLLIVSGRLIDRVGASRVFAFAAATAALRWLLTAHARSAAAILLLQPLHGVSFGLFYVAGVMLTRAQAPRAVQTAAQGLFGAAYALGSVVGMPLAGHLLERVGATAVYHTAAAFAALAFACALALLRKRDG